MANSEQAAEKAVENFLQGFVKEYKPSFPVHLLEIWEFNPRTNNDPRPQEELSASIAKEGVQEPLKILEIEGNFYVFDGGRRLRGAWEAGLETVPVFIFRDISKAQALVLAAISNISPERMDPLDEGKLMEDILKEDPNLSLVALAKIIGHTEDWIRGRIAISNLHPDIKLVIKAGKLNNGEINIILSCPENMRLEALKRILALKDELLGNGKAAPNLHDVKGVAVTLAEEHRVPLPGHKAGVRSVLEKTPVAGQVVPPRKRNYSNGGGPGRRVPATGLELEMQKAKNLIRQLMIVIKTIGQFPDDQLAPVRISQLIKEGRFNTSVLACFDEAELLAADLRSLVLRLVALGHDIAGS